MKINNLLIGLLSLITLILSNMMIVSCSDDDGQGNDKMVLIEEDVVPNPMDAYIPLKKEEIPLTESVLGYGYDVMGVAGSYQSVKNQVVDLNKMQEEYPDAITGFRSLASYSYSIYGENKTKYMHDMPYFFLDSELKEQEELEGKILQTKTFDDYEFLSDTKSEYSYRSEHTYYLRNRYFFNTLILNRYKCIKQSFTDDLNVLTANEIIKKYGTHVIAEFYDGIRFDLLYMAKIYPSRYSHKGEIITVSNDKMDAVTVGYYKARVETGSSSLNWGSLPENSETLLKANINPILYLNAVGGNPSVVSKGFYNLEKGYPKSNQAEWSATFENIDDDALFKMVKIRELIPIYQCVEDPQKKALIKQAVLEYIDANQPK